jgi:phosphohistidine phosphatase
MTIRGLPILRLLLLRHAKSDWSRGADDHDRPLSGRGLTSAPEIARYMRSRLYVPAAVLCSTAKRARQTLDLLLPEWEATPAIRYDRALYLAEWPNLLAALRKAPSHASPLLVVGHNPGLEQLAVALAMPPQTPAERGRLQRMAQKYPTAALAIFDFDVESWRSLRPGIGHLVEFVRPKDVARRSAMES